MNDSKETFFESYGALAENIDNDIIISGRNNFQKDSVSHIIDDVTRKLQLQKTDRLLEIGCNIGLLLTPLSQTVAHVTGIDHSNLIAKLHAKGVGDNVDLIAGSWPEASSDQKFDCILVYSVIHCLPSRAFSLKFIVSAIDALTSGGRLLIGDLPNEDMRNRFMNSSTGHKVAEAYNKQRDEDVQNAEVSEHYQIRNKVWPKDVNVFVDDQYVFDVLSLARNKGFDAFVYPQSKDLPFGYSREDILITRRD